MVWLYTWSTVKDNLEGGDWDQLVSEDEAWDLLCEAIASGNGFSLEYGAEQHHEEVLEWMLSRDLINDMDEDDSDV